MRIVIRRAAAGGLLILPLLLTSCSRKSAPAAAPPAVEVTTVVQKDLPIEAEWIGSLDGYVNAEIRPQVEGYVLRQAYRDGALVHAGDVLFELDPRQFQAAYDQARGNLAQYQAMLANAKTKVGRYTTLAAERAVSQQELDDAVTQERTAKANVEATQAALEKARLDLGRTKIASPIEGISSIARAQVGNLVNGSTVMTTVSQVDPIKVLVTSSEQEYSTGAARYSDAGKREQFLENLEFELILANRSVYPRKGKFHALDRSVDVQTGSIRFATAFPNPGNLLRPGQFGRVRATVETRKAALLVPQAAVTELQGTYQVAVITSDNKASIRPVKVGDRFGQMWEIREGLKSGETVVVQGVQKVEGGKPVSAKPWTPPAGKSAVPGTTARKQPG